MRVLGLDPGFASVGYAVVDYSRPGTGVVACAGVIRTEKSSRKRNVRASEDNLERAREIAKALEKVMRDNDVRLICAETMSFPRSSGVAAKVAMCWGVVAGLSLRIPVAQASPQEIKKALTGRKDSSKEDVQAAVVALFPELPEKLSSVPRSLLEHPCDAVAAVVACEQGELLRLARSI